MPATLDQKLKNAELDLVDLGFSADELRNNVTGFVSKKSGLLKFNGVSSSKEPIEDIYFYFNSCEDHINIPLNEIGFLPLMMKNYGFEGESSRLKPNKVYGLNLNSVSREKYDSLLLREEATLGEILETVGSIVNSSMRYDFEKIIGREQASGHVSDWSDAKLNYAPTGEEVSQGICVDAGEQIRNILYNLGLDSKYKILFVGSDIGGFYHDTTLVFNKESGNWGVINSKSPTKEFNFATKEQLKQLGSPYYSG